MKSTLSIPQRLAIGVGVTIASGLMFVGVGLSLEHRNARLARVIASTPLEMWSAQAVDASGALYGHETQVCADPMVRDGLQRTTPRINGELCLLADQAVTRGDNLSVRCTAGGGQYALSIARVGDIASDFTVRMRLQPIGVDNPGVVQTIRYRRLGPCPAGWRPGQSVTSADGKAFDALDPAGPTKKF